MCSAITISQRHSSGFGILAFYATPGLYCHRTNIWFHPIVPNKSWNDNHAEWVHFQILSYKCRGPPGLFPVIYGMGNRIGGPSSNFSLAWCSHFWTFGKGMNLPILLLNMDRCSPLELGDNQFKRRNTPNFRNGTCKLLHYLSKKTIKKNWKNVERDVENDGCLLPEKSWH